MLRDQVHLKQDFVRTEISVTSLEGSLPGKYSGSSGEGKKEEGKGEEEKRREGGRKEGKEIGEICLHGVIYVLPPIRSNYNCYSQV